MLPFHCDQKEFEGTTALAFLFQRTARGRGRWAGGDKLGMAPRGVLFPSEPVFPTFRSLLQGDHLGVEFALSAHGALLRDVGPLHPEEEVRGDAPFPIGPNDQGLVSDDFFCVSIQRCGLLPHDKHSVLGSPEKDIIGSTHFKVIGA